jgi:Glucose / Sorbosone dehydrogenase
MIRPGGGDNAGASMPAAELESEPLSDHQVDATPRRRSRVRLLAVLVALAALLLIFLAWPRDSVETGFPMDIEWAGEVGYASMGDGQLVRLRVEGDRVTSEVLATGALYPRGLAVTDDTIYVAELGELPCQDPVPRCKGEHIGPTTADGERTLIDTTAGRVLAYPINGDGTLGSPGVVIDQLSFVNTDHALNDLELGPDGSLYLSIGNLDQLAWDDDGQPPEGPATDLLGSVLRIDPDTGSFDVFATGLRNVYGLAFDEDGALWGVDNDGRGRGLWRFEELTRIEEGLDYGFPDEGTIGPYERRTGFPVWILPGSGSSGILVEDGTIISGACGDITRLRLDTQAGDADLEQVDNRGCVTAIERLPDGRLLLGTVLGGQPIRVVTEASLFGD